MKTEDKDKGICELETMLKQQWNNLSEEEKDQEMQKIFRQMPWFGNRTSMKEDE